VTMGIDWTDVRREIAEAIPPAYAEFVGHGLMEHLSDRCMECGSIVVWATGAWRHPAVHSNGHAPAVVAR
jgi:hypothetical protein